METEFQPLFIHSVYSKSIHSLTSANTSDLLLSFVDILPEKLPTLESIDAPLFCIYLWASDCIHCISLAVSPCFAVVVGFFVVVGFLVVAGFCVVVCRFVVVCFLEVVEEPVLLLAGFCPLLVVVSVAFRWESSSSCPEAEVPVPPVVVSLEDSADCATVSDFAALSSDTVVLSVVPLSLTS